MKSFVNLQNTNIRYYCRCNLWLKPNKMVVLFLISKQMHSVTFPIHFHRFSMKERDVCAYKRLHAHFQKHFKAWAWFSNDAHADEKRWRH